MRFISVALFISVAPFIRTSQKSYVGLRDPGGFQVGGH